MSRIGLGARGPSGGWAVLELDLESVGTEVGSLGSSQIQRQTESLSIRLSVGPGEASE
jgi:hypothetical protein